MKILPEIKVKVSIENRENTYQISGSESASNVIREIFDADSINWTETLFALFLDRQNKVIGYFKVAAGGTAEITVDPKVIFVSALTSLAHGIILAHNHPSGNTRPSKADISFTSQIASGAKLLGMKLFDHFIITDTAYTSMADEGHL